MGVPKFQLRLPRLWGRITSCANLWLQWDLKQRCSPCRELSNGVSHSTCTHQGRVDSWLLVVRSQTANLTPGLSFCHNLCCRCPNGSCESIFNIYTLIAFNDTKNALVRGVWTPKIELWRFGSPSGLPSPHFPFRKSENHPPTLPKVGLWHIMDFWNDDIMFVTHRKWKMWTQKICHSNIKIKFKIGRHKMNNLIVKYI